LNEAIRMSGAHNYRPSRETDELRVARGTLHHRSSNRSIEVGVLQIRREHPEQETVLVVTVQWGSQVLASRRTTG